MSPHLSRRLAAEAAGTLGLVCAVVGSGIMAAGLTPDPGLELLCNAVATGAMLVVLITLLGPVSGAQFNPAVTLVLALNREIGRGEAAATVAAQAAGGVLGTWLAHAMFAVPVLEVSGHIRSGGAQWLAEAVASFGLMATILLGRRARPEALAWLVGLYLVAAYWFTASTAFANPAVALARGFTDSFSGIRPADVPGFVLAEILGAVTGWAACRWLLAAPVAAPGS